MSQNIEIINLGFSVADAENITFKYDGADLILGFNDWEENQVTVECKNTLGFKFQNAEYELSESERYDSIHIVHDSEWVKEHVKQGEAWEGENWLHYKLNFNEAGVVEVLCSKLVKT